MTSGDEPRWFIFRAVCGIGYASAPGKPTKLGRLGKYILQKFDIEPNRREKMLVLHRVCSQRGLYIHMAIELKFSYSIKERLYSGLVQPVANWESTRELPRRMGVRTERAGGKRYSRLPGHRGVIAQRVRVRGPPILTPPLSSIRRQEHHPFYTSRS